MSKKLNRLMSEIREAIIEDFDSDYICIEDIGIKTSNGTPITHLATHSSQDENYIGLWCGSPDPDEDKDAEELIVSDDELKDICEDILELL